MKTPQEIKFQNLIIKIIEYKNENSFEQRYQSLKEFYENEKTYYEIFCDYVYHFSVSTASESVVIDPSGYPHLMLYPEKFSDYFVVLSEKDRMVYCEDIIVYIDIALNNLEGLL